MARGIMDRLAYGIGTTLDMAGTQPADIPFIIVRIGYAESFDSSKRHQACDFVFG